MRRSCMFLSIGALSRGGEVPAEPQATRGRRPPEATHKSEERRVNSSHSLSDIPVNAAALPTQEHVNESNFCGERGAAGDASSIRTITSGATGYASAAGNIAHSNDPAKTRLARIPSVRNVLAFLIANFYIVYTSAIGYGQSSPREVQAVAETELPYNQPPINYSSRQPDDAVTRLRQRLQNGQVELTDRGAQGKLQDLLKALEIPIESQLLVFSKSSANARLITPKTPRAIYFNDEVYVGWVPGSPMVEISTVEPNVGAVFYNLPQATRESATPGQTTEPQFRRDDSCLLCHVTRSTLRVPGHLDRSFTTDFEGQLRTGWSRITHATRYQDRWAGWYVTGGSETFKHLGNVYGDESRHDSPQHNLKVNTVTDLSKQFDTRDYLTATSDIVAHLVLDHQAHGHNLITRLNYESQLGRPTTAFDPLLRYFLFLDEPQLQAPITTHSDYRIWFEGRGPRDSQGRSLRQFDLNTRLFKYRLSYLIYSAAFDALPDSVRLEFYRDLKSWLTTTDPQHPAEKLPLKERQAIQEILRETKSKLPQDW